MTRIRAAVSIAFASSFAIACGQTELVPGAPTAVSCALSVSPTTQASSRAGGAFTLP